MFTLDQNNYFNNPNKIVSTFVTNNIVKLFVIKLQNGHLCNRIVVSRKNQTYDGGIAEEANI